jgi:hypothetical protein
MTDREPPHAPWRLVGECILAWTRPPRSHGRLLPEGLRPLPGPAAVVGVRYDQSPIGPYLELSVAVPARVGLRPGLCVVYQAVSSALARQAYRANWGLPTVVASLSWAADDDSSERELRCDDPSIVLRGHPLGPPIPSFVPVRSVQRRSDGPVVLPRRFVSMTRLARTTVDLGSPPAPPLGWMASLAGKHPGAVMTGARIVAAPARHPLGLWSSLRAPLEAAEPAFFRDLPG